jgi:hypothetical protein
MMARDFLVDSSEGVWRAWRYGLAICSEQDITNFILSALTHQLRPHTTLNNLNRIYDTITMGGGGGRLPGQYVNPNSTTHDELLQLQSLPAAKWHTVYVAGLRLTKQQIYGLVG